MKKIPILIISFALCLIFTPLVFADEITGDLGGNGFVSGINGGVPNDPVASPANGYSASSAFTVTLTAANSTTIRYTVNGSTPACPATGTLYAGAITIDTSKTVRAIACYAAGSTVPSNVLSFAYTISGGGGGGGAGGAGNITYCSAITYSDWGTCVNNLHTRSVLTQSPSGCTLTTTQQISLQQTCTPTATSTPPTNPPTNPPADNGNGTNGQDLISTILDEAGIVNSGNLTDLLNILGATEDQSLETAGELKYKKILGLDKRLSTEEIDAITRFIVYGTPTTQILGAGERAGVINSYFNAYGKLPNTEAEWGDVIKIANGRWPIERNAKAEAQAKVEFKKVYARNANLSNNIDENAIMVIAYGLLPSHRNLASEKTAIKTFKWVYGHAPVTALAWNVVRAIAYSGAKR